MAFTVNEHNTYHHDAIFYIIGLARMCINEGKSDVKIKKIKRNGLEILQIFMKLNLIFLGIFYALWEISNFELHEKSGIIFYICEKLHAQKIKLPIILVQLCLHQYARTCLSFTFILFIVKETKFPFHAKI